MSKVYYGQWNPSVDKVLEERYFMGKYNLTAIECGAFDGVLENCTKFFEDYYRWKTINVEPVPHVYEKLCTNRPNSVNINVALSDSNCKRQFTHVIHPYLGRDYGNGSLLHKQSHLDILLQEKCTFQQVEVECQTYKTLMETLQLQTLDLFVLDVEGHELEVLDGMEGSQVWPSVFVIEYPHVGLDVLADRLKSRYKLDFTSFNNAFFILNSTPLPL